MVRQKVRSVHIRGFTIRCTLVVLIISLGMVRTDSTSAQPPGRNPMALMDQDKNGSVSLEELRAYKPQVTDKNFAQWDRDDNGELNKEELTAAIREVLEFELSCP